MAGWSILASFTLLASTSKSNINDTNNLNEMLELVHKT